MTTVRVEVSEAQLAAALTSPHVGLAWRFVDELTTDVRNRAVLYAPVRTGRLRASITPSVSVRGMVVEGRVGSDVNYALPVHEGSRPHVIRPRHGKVLRFPGGSGGAFVYAAKVNHPGTKGRPFLRQALEDTVAERGIG